MRKFLSLLLMALATLTASAQNYPQNGYYRVQNRGNGKRYITLIDNRGSIDYTALNNSDLYASRLRPFEATATEPGVVDDPGSIFFATQVNSGEYDLAAQGTSVSDLVSGIYLHLGASGNDDFPWLAYGVKQGVTVYICGSSAKGANGTLYKLGVGNKASGSTFHWAITPVTATGDNYFGLIPDVTAKGSYYKAFFAGFPFQTTGSMKAYYVTKVDKSRGLVVWEEIIGTVPTKTPVIVKCAGAGATNNRLDLQMTSPAAISDNQLRGVYFSNNEGDGHTNYVAFDAGTMRVLGTCQDGSVGYVAPAGLERIPANSSYLVVGSGAPAELKLVTQKEYEDYQAVTITAKSYTRQYGEDNPTFEFTASGTYTGTPEITCEATKTSPVGTYPIVVKAGTVQGQVTAVNGTLTITKAPLTITAKSYIISQTDALPDFEATYSGFKNGETNSVLTTPPTLTTNAPADKKPGTYDITPAGAAATNYDISYVKGTLTITQASTITITAKDATMVYGDDVPQLQYEVSGGTLTGTPKLVCNATKTSDVGSYDITVDVSAISYPNLKTVPAKLTIIAAPVSVTAKSYTIVETDSLPAFEATYSGFKNGETNSVLTTPPTLTTDAPADKTPGEYTITVSDAEAKNYTFSYTDGKLTINEAPTITVTAEAKTMTYGGEVPALTYTVEGGTLTGTPVLSTTATSKSDVGEYDITIDKGSIDYPRLKLNGAKLTVTKAMVTVNAGTYTMKQTEKRPAFKATYSGWKNDDTEAVLTKQPILTTTAPTDNAPGEYVVTASGAVATNYDFTYVEGKLIITAADAITIVATNATMVYGDDVPQLEYTISDDTVTGTPVLTCEAKKTSDAGEYVIKVEKGTVDYPNLVLVNGTLTINKAVLTVTAEDATREEGQPNPEFTLTYSGWKNGDTEAVLTVKPVAATVADASSQPGEYAITVSGGEAKNYTFKHVAGRLTVTAKQPTTVVIDDEESGSEVTIILSDEGTATFAGIEAIDEDGDVDSVTIPETVSVDGEEYTVNEIAESAFEGMTTLETVVIPNTIEQIGADAFKGCTGLASIYVRWEDPIALMVAASRGMNNATADDADPVFSGVDKDVCVLYVPVGSKAKYEAAPVWSTFKNIMEYDVQGVAGIGTGGGRFEVFSLSGCKVRSNATTLQGLPRGLYIINGKKVLVK